MWRDHGNGSSQIATKLRHTAVVVPRAGGRLPETAGGGERGGARSGPGLLWRSNRSCGLRQCGALCQDGLDGTWQ